MQHADAVALRRGVNPLPVVEAGAAGPAGRAAEAVAVHSVRLSSPSTSQPGRITPSTMYLPCTIVDCAKYM